MFQGIKLPIALLNTLYCRAHTTPLKLTKQSMWLSSVDNASH